MRILICVVLAAIIEQSQMQDTEEESRLLVRKKIRKLCRIFGQGRELSDEEARTLVFLQVQQVQGYPGGGPSHTSSDPLSGLCSSHSGGGGGLLGGNGGLLGGLLGSPVDSEPPLGGISQVGEILGGGPPRRANILGVRPERYVRQFYRYLNRLFR